RTRIIAGTSRIRPKTTRIPRPFRAGRLEPGASLARALRATAVAAAAVGPVEAAVPPPVAEPAAAVAPAEAAAPAAPAAPAVVVAQAGVARRATARSRATSRRGAVRSGRRSRSRR